MAFLLCRSHCTTVQRPGCWEIKRTLKVFRYRSNLVCKKFSCSFYKLISETETASLFFRRDNRRVKTITAANSGLNHIHTMLHEDRFLSKSLWQNPRLTLVAMPSISQSRSLQSLSSPKQHSGSWKERRVTCRDVRGRRYTHTHTQFETTPLWEASCSRRHMDLLG